MFFLDEQKLKETKEEKITHTTDLVESVNEEEQFKESFNKNI